MNVTYNPAERPERQQGLNKIPRSTTISHPGIRRAVEVYEKARADEVAKRQDFNQAEIELPAAQFRDEQALAAAKSAKKADPGPVEEEKQLALVRESRRQHGAAKILLAEAVSNVGQTFVEHGDEWRADLEHERDELRAAIGGALDEFEAAWGRLRVNAAARSVARGGNAGGSPASSFKVPRVLDGDVIAVDDVLAGLRSLGARENQQGAPASVSFTAGARQPINPSPNHRPPRMDALSGAGAPVGASRDPEAVKAWVERDEAEARARGAGLAAGRRAERLARAGTAQAEREATAEAVADEIEAVA